MTYARGDVAVLRHFQLGRVYAAVPARVVDETADRIVLWIAPGTLYRRPLGRLSPTEIAANAWRADHRPWEGNGTLVVAPRGEPFSIWHFWNDDGGFDRWYFNLELPWHPSPIGFDTRDHQLDVVARADGSWQWKDEEELIEAVHAGLLDDADAREIVDAGRRVIASLAELVPTGYESWRPDAGWALPSLSEGWDAS